MRLLSFDTSTIDLHVSLMNGSQCAAEAVVPPASSERQEVASVLLPEIDNLMRQAGWHKRDLDGIVVGTGPGSFTGIRVGVISGRTLAQTLKLPLWGVSYFQTLARHLPEPGAVVLSAGATHAFAGAYSAQSDELLPPAYIPYSELPERLSVYPRWFADEKSRDQLEEKRCAPLPEINNIATAQSGVALDRLSLLGLYTDTSISQNLCEKFPWWEVTPLYLRNPSVTLKTSDGRAYKANDVG